MNRRTFFRTLLAAACTAVARAYVPAALVVADPPAAKSIGVLMQESIWRMGDAVPSYFYASPTVLGYLREIALAKPNRWQRRQRRLARSHA